MCTKLWLVLLKAMAQVVKNLPAMQETWVQSLGGEDPLEWEMATHSSILAWRIPWTESDTADRLTHTNSRAWILVPRRTLYSANDTEINVLNCTDEPASVKESSVKCYTNVEAGGETELRIRFLCWGHVCVLFFFFLCFYILFLFF